DFVSVPEVEGFCNVHVGSLVFASGVFRCAPGKSKSVFHPPFRGPPPAQHSLEAKRSLARKLVPKLSLGTRGNLVSDARVTPEADRSEGNERKTSVSPEFRPSSSRKCLQPTKDRR